MCLSICYGFCCMGKALCSCCCKGLSACGVPAKNFPKAAYVVTDILFMILAVVLMYTMKPLFEDYDWLECNDNAGGGDGCFGTSAVLRASFILFLYHIFILLVICPRGHCSSVAHDGWFTLKFLFIFAAYIASFWIPYEFFQGWAEFCRVGSVLYLAVQSYFLLNFAYIYNDQLWAVAGQADGGCYAKFLLASFTIILALVNVIWLAFQFVAYSGCLVGVITLVITTLFFIFFYIVAFLKCCDVDLFRPNATVFVVGFATLYVVFLSWTALASHPDKECNENIDSGVNTTLQIVVGTIFGTWNVWSIAVASTDDAGAQKEKATMG